MNPVLLSLGVPRDRDLISLRAETIGFSVENDDYVVEFESEVVREVCAW